MGADVDFFPYGLASHDSLIGAEIPRLIPRDRGSTPATACLEAANCRAADQANANGVEDSVRRDGSDDASPGKVKYKSHRRGESSHDQEMVKESAASPWRKNEIQIQGTRRGFPFGTTGFCPSSGIAYANALTAGSPIPFTGLAAGRHFRKNSAVRAGLVVASDY